MARNPPDNYSDKEAKERFEATLRGALKTPPKPYKTGVVKKAKKHKSEKKV